MAVMRARYPILAFAEPVGLPRSSRSRCPWGPGDETGSRGLGKAVYFFDPSKDLIEIKHYETSSD